MLGGYVPFLRASRVSDYTRTNTHLKKHDQKPTELQSLGTACLGRAVLCCAVPCGAVLCCAVLVGIQPWEQSPAAPLPRQPGAC